MLVNNGPIGGPSIGLPAPNTGQSGNTNTGSSSGSGLGAITASRDYNNDFNLAQASALNAFNAAEAEKQRKWQEKMSNTAHQREVQDLIAAGLNPVLSAMGQGASTPSGGVASGSKATADTSLSEGLISMMAAMISASSAQTIASMYIENERYMAANYPTTKFGFLNTLLSGENSAGKIGKGFLNYDFSKLFKYRNGSSARNFSVQLPR